MGIAKKYGNNFELIRDREEDYRIRICDKGVGSYDHTMERNINVSLFERLKVKQPAVAWQLGLLAGWEME